MWGARLAIQGAVGGGLLALALFTGMGAPALSSQAAKLTVIVEDVRSRSGIIQVALWSDPDGFTQSDKVVANSAAPAIEGSDRLVFSDLKPGRYALVAYHDENGNGELDQTLVGLPAEGLGFSNNAWISGFGPPSFEEAAIEVRGDNASTTITLRY